MRIASVQAIKHVISIQLNLLIRYQNSYYEIHFSHFPPNFIENQNVHKARLALPILHTLPFSPHFSKRNVLQVQFYDGVSELLFALGRLTPAVARVDEGVAYFPAKAKHPSPSLRYC